MQLKDPAALKRWRLHRGFSQRDLGFLTRRSQTAIWQLEAGKLKNLSEGFALSIANRLNVPWEDLFDANERELAKK
ncbi:MAG: helix-turn-helix domain-containing protein [Promicromonosporaceae bacterium]|nr:helix-turn-helix domain-containing protein [Promicromonosporaceae bacterium]